MQYRLRTLLIGISLAAVLSAAARWSWRRNAAEQATVQFLVAQGARCDYSEGMPLGRLEGWVDARLGREFRSDVTNVQIYDSQAQDPEVVRALRRLPGLRKVTVACWPTLDVPATNLRGELHDLPVEVEAAFVLWRLDPKLGSLQCNTASARC